jgi:hypothetical protein
MAKKEGKQAETGAVVVTQAAAPAPPTEKKIAIVGCSDTKHLAPHNDPSWEMWGMNNAYTNVPRRTGWFEIHPIKFADGKYFRRKLLRPGVFEWSNEFRGQPMEAYIKDLAGLDVPVYMQQHWDAIPKSVPYPLQDITSRFGNYFTNSVSYMIALAIMQGATEIGCYGVDMATGCFTGDTKIQLAADGPVSLATLVNRRGSFGVWSRDKDGNVVTARGHSARLTKRNARLVGVCFGDGSFARCTPDHPFMLSDGSYIQAQSLTATHILAGSKRVERVYERPEREDVYDITVDKTHNFLLANGACVHNSEYGPQRPSCEYFLGIAVGLGIKIVIPKQMDLLKTKFLYGFGEVEAQAWETKLVQMLEAMDARQQKAINTMEIAKKQNDQYIGAKEALKEIQRIWANFNESKIWQDPY